MDIQAIIFGTEAVKGRNENGENSEKTFFQLQKRGYKIAAVETSLEGKSRSRREILLGTAKTLGVPPNECAVVENMPLGIDAAKSSGMTAIGIGGAGNYIFADMCIGKISELLDIFA